MTKFISLYKYAKINLCPKNLPGEIHLTRLQVITQILQGL